MNGRAWTSDDTARLRRLARSGMDDEAIGDEMDRDRTLIVRKRQEHHIERGQSAVCTAIVARLNLRRRMARV